MKTRGNEEDETERDNATKNKSYGNSLVIF